MEELKEKVYEAIGEASMCWIPIPSGVFDSTKAKEIGDRLFDEISRYEAKAEPLAVKKEPHIICLAAAKHYRLRPAMTAKAWIISLVKIGNRADKFVAHGETYWEAEQAARAYLNGLADKGEK